MAGLQGVTGAVVALDPSTGAILGMASTPTYDPNQLSSHDPDAIRAYAEQLEASRLPTRGSTRRSARTTRPARSSRSSSRRPRWRTGYTPGPPIPAPDLLTLPNTSTTLSNFNGGSCNGGADQPLIDALTVSCNTAFALLGIELGEDKVREMAEAFGLDGESVRHPAARSPTATSATSRATPRWVRPRSASATSA